MLASALLDDQGKEIFGPHRVHACNDKRKRKRGQWLEVDSRVNRCFVAAATAAAVAVVVHAAVPS